MHNELLKIGSITIYGYGLMIAIGILAAYLVAEYRAKRKGLDSEPVFICPVLSPTTISAIVVSSLSPER